MDKAKDKMTENIDNMLSNIESTEALVRATATLLPHPIVAKPTLTAATPDPNLTFANKSVSHSAR